MPAELALVMPVYNEAACIRQVLESWQRTLSQLAVSCRFVIVDDGSTDETETVLAEVARDPSIIVIRQENAGHGPALLTGYRAAKDLAPWVFQSDSDEEMNPEDFPALWRDRDRLDAGFGVRVRSKSNLARRVITGVAHRAVKTLMGDRVEDPNVPFRLLRSDVLGAILPLIPRDAFAPNLMISGVVSRWQLRVGNYPLRNRPRQSGVSARREIAVLLGVAKAAWQLVAFAMKTRATKLHANAVSKRHAALSDA